MLNLKQYNTGVINKHLNNEEKVSPSESNRVNSNHAFGDVLKFLGENPVNIRVTKVGGTIVYYEKVYLDTDPIHYLIKVHYKTKLTVRSSSFVLFISNEGTGFLDVNQIEFIEIVDESVLNTIQTIAIKLFQMLKKY